MTALVLAVVAMSTSVTGCERSNRSGAVLDPELRAALLERVAKDQAVRDSFAEQLRTSGTVSPPTIQSMMAIDSANVEWLKERVRATGIPSREAVGEDGVRAVLLLIQHADRDPEWQATMLPEVEKAFLAGDVTGQAYAMLSDRVAKARGQPQRYGTQATLVDGRMRIDPIEDSAGVDARRAALGLMPLAQYQQTLDSVYAKRSPEP